MWRANSRGTTQKIGMCHLVFVRSLDADAQRVASGQIVEKSERTPDNTRTSFLRVRRTEFPRFFLVKIEMEEKHDTS